MIDGWLNQIANVITNNLWLAPILALLAGILTSFLPCSLTNIPLIIGYVGGTGEKNTKKALGYSLVFAIGSAVTFVVLGIVATTAGKLIGTTSTWWYIVLGVVMLLMALQTWGIFNFIPSTNLITKGKKRGFIGALLAGILGGLFSSPCSTPILIVLLAMIAGKANMLFGIFLMLLYSIGHSALAIIAGTSIGFVQKLNSNERFERIGTILKIVMGVVILFIGFYMFWLAF